jgi:hypothetical protein
MKYFTKKNCNRRVSGQAIFNQECSEDLLNG